MGDENSLQGQTRQHKHSAPSSDGGFLETTVTGVTNLSNGSMMYGDASEQVTELSAGNVSDVLTMGATLPSWQPASGGAVGWELIDSQILAVDAGFIQSSFPAVNQSDVSCFKVIVNVEKLSASNELGGRLNGLVTNYDENFFETYGALTGGWLTTGNNHFGLIMNAKGNFVCGEWTIWCNAVSDTLQCLWRGGTSITNTITSQNNTTAGQTSLSDVYIYPTAGNLRSGSRIDIYRVNI